MPRFEIAAIRRYYDRNTPAFVALGQGRGVGAIHRAVWGPGVRDRAEAFQFVEKEIAAATSRITTASATPHVVDLGCGVGASLCYLAERMPIRGTGVTLSPVQAAMATRAFRERNLSDQLVCLEGDYNNLPPGIAPADLAYAIESFVHGPAPERFFDECRRLIRPGGLLIICDDFRRPVDHPEAERTIDRFCMGWRINTLLTASEIQAMARSAGFEHESTLDLSPWLEINRTRDRLISLFLALFGWLPLENTRLGHLAGGRALQTCLQRGWIGYELAVFRRALVL